MTSEERAAEVAEIIAEAAKLPLKDAAFSLWRQYLRLDTLEGRPTDEQVRIYRAMSPAQQSATYRHERDHAEDGPSFTHLKRAHPRASDTEIKLAIMAAVKFDDACAKYFSTDYGIDFWQRCVDAWRGRKRKTPAFSKAHTSTRAIKSPTTTNSSRGLSFGSMPAPAPNGFPDHHPPKSTGSSPHCRACP